MASLISRHFKIESAEALKGNIDSEAVTYYFFVGKATDWSTPGTPDIPNDSRVRSDIDVWNKIVELKKITPQDVSFCIPLYRWSTNTVYPKYKSYEDIYQNQSSANTFYVVTSADRVYKCIDNFAGANSSIEPSQTDLVNTFRTGDGYEWKYMYPIVGSDQEKFISSTHIPVKVVTSESNFNTEQFNIQTAAVDGTVDSIDVVAAGSNYINFSGNISEYANSTVVYIANTNNGANRVIDDYYRGCRAYVQSGKGSGQLVDIADYEASTAKLTFSTALSSPLAAASAIDPSYLVIGPKVTVKTNGTGVTAYANVNLQSSNGVNRINIVTKGSGSTEGIVIIEDGTYLSATGTGATATINVSPRGGHGSDAHRELGIGALMFSVRMDQNDPTSALSDTDFAMYGIIEAPTYANNTVASNTTIDNTTKLDIINAVGLSNTAVISGWTVAGETSNATAKAIKYTSTGTGSANGVLIVSEIYEANGEGFSSSEVVVLNNSQSTKGTIGGIRTSVLKQNSGNVLYVENRELVERDPQQTEDFKVVLQY